MFWIAHLDWLLLPVTRLLVTSSKWHHVVKRSNTRRTDVKDPGGWDCVVRTRYLS